MKKKKDPICQHERLLKFAYKMQVVIPTFFFAAAAYFKQHATKIENVC